MLQVSRPHRSTAVTTSGRPLSLLLVATLSAAAGNGISIVAFPWLVLQHRGSVLDASIVAAAAALPPLISTLIAGTAIDMLGRRRMSILSDVLSGVTVAAVPLVAMAFGAQAVDVVVLATLAALGAAFDPAGITARRSMLPEAAQCAGWTLDRVNAVHGATFNAAYIVGPGLGGLLIPAIGGINTMWVTAGAFAVSIASMAALRLEGSGPPTAQARPEHVWAGVVEGLKFVWNLRLLRVLALVHLVIAASYLPMEGVLFPKYFSDRNEPAQLGWVLVAMSLGALVGALAYPLLVRCVTRRAILLIATLTLGLCSAAMSLLPPIAVMLLLSAVVGLACGPVQPLYNYVMQTKAPPHLRGRVIAAMTSLAYSAGPVGFLLAGPLVDTFGLPATFLALSIPIAVTGLVLVRLPLLHELDRTPTSPTRGVPGPGIRGDVSANSLPR
ncbi:MFS transporter [Mycobacterium spongiae]|uniref:Multidrug efflux pump Tap n=1 Tax=Mycobacterium spongiae TaxID=886343 RepID=A0A975PWC7_9MYCO|nr:MFS transporter [Mycobacterium spongiae]QUR67076.1 MFS transporter [Mycobacterium spongiae]